MEACTPYAHDVGMEAGTSMRRYGGIRTVTGEVKGEVTDLR
jgi:hypothetical protein